MYLPCPYPRVLTWAARLLGLLFPAFVSLFALDVFDLGYGFWEMLLALAMHLLPTAYLLAALAVAWRWGWAGAILYTGFAAWYVASFWGDFPLPVYLVFAGVPLLVGLLFLAGWFARRPVIPSPDH
jgi:hypothetical protein